MAKDRCDRGLFLAAGTPKDCFQLPYRTLEKEIAGVVLNLHESPRRAQKV
jgi:hypothetical protein